MISFLTFAMVAAMFVPFAIDKAGVVYKFAKDTVAKF